MRGHNHPAPSRTSVTVASLLNILRQAGLRITKSRQQILETLMKASEPLSLDAIQRASEVDGVPPDFATVFRVMTMLEDLRLVRQVPLNRPSRFYELLDPSEHHDHLVCTECGRVTQMTDQCPVQLLEESIEERYGYSDIRHSLEFFGVCPECKP